MPGKNRDQIYIERREAGDYAVRRGGAERASAVKPTQREAIDRAIEIAPEAPIHVERVRNTDLGHRDKWRKPQYLDRFSPTYQADWCRMIAGIEMRPVIS